MATDAGLQEDEESSEGKTPVKEKRLKLKDVEDGDSNTHFRNRNKENCTPNRKELHDEEKNGDNTNRPQENKDSVRVEENQEGKDLPDPLRVDLYERLLVEKDNDDQNDLSHWDNYNACQDLQKACQKLSCSERQFYAILMSVFAAMTFAMVFGLFVLQAQITMSSHEILTQVQSAQKEIPKGMYNLYFDYLDSGIAPDKVDLRVNTSIFVH